MANIKDVAELAGVSVSTVSNVLNDKVSVSEKLYQRVVRAMQELNYHPNLQAMNLRNKKVSFIGIIVSDLSGHYHQIIEGIFRVINQKNGQLILKIVKNAQEEQRAIDTLVQLNVGGIIVISSIIDERLISRYQSLQQVVVFADLYPKNYEYSMVRFDNYSIVKKLTGELLERNLRVGLVCGAEDLGSEDDCIRGYLSCFPEETGEGSVLFTIGMQKEWAFSDLIESMHRCPEIPDCLIASNDQLAEIAFDVCNTIGANHVKIYALSGNSCFTNYHENIVRIQREAILCGMEVAGLVLKKLENAISFDTRQITIEDQTGGISGIEIGAGVAGQEKGQKTLRLLLLESRVSNAIWHLAADFTNRTGLEVSITTAGQQELLRMIREEVDRGSNRYDIYMVDIDWLPMLRKKNALYRLNERMDIQSLLSRYIPSISEHIMAGDEICALPILSGYQMLAYRRDLFEDATLKKMFYIKHGIPLQPPRTWNEFNLVAKFFTREFNEDSPVKYGTCLRGSLSNGIMSEFLPRLWSYQERMFNRGKISVDSVVNLEALRNICECYRYSYPDCMNYFEEQQIEEFLRGDIAMISTWNVHWQNKRGGISSCVAFENIPGNISLNGEWLLGINSLSAQAEESICFLKWEMSDKISVQSALLGQVSPFQNVFHNNELKTIYPWIDVVYKGSTITKEKELKKLFPVRDGEAADLELVIAGNIRKTMMNEITPEDALKNIKEYLRT